MAAQRRQRAQERLDLGGPEEVRARGQRQLVAPQRGGVFPVELGVQVGEGPGHALGIVEEERDLRGQVVEQGGEAAGVEAGEERLHPEEGRARLDGVDHLADLGGGTIDLLGQLAHRPDGGLSSTGREWGLAGLDHHQLLDVAERALRAGLEGARALHLVAEELEPDRAIVERAPDVHHRAPDREGPGVLDQRDPGVAELDQPARERVAVDGDALAEEFQVAPQLGARDVAPGQRARRDHHRANLRAGEVEPGERRQPVHLQPAVGGEVVVGEHGIGGHPDHRRRSRAALAQEERQVAGEEVGLLLVGGDGEEGPSSGTEHPEGGEPPGRPGEADHVGAAGGQGIGDGAPGCGSVLGHERPGA